MCVVERKQWILFNKEDLSSRSIDPAILCHRHNFRAEPHGLATRWKVNRTRKVHRSFRSCNLTKIFGLLTYLSGIWDRWSLRWVIVGENRTDDLSPWFLFPPKFKAPNALWSRRTQNRKKVIFLGADKSKARKTQKRDEQINIIINPEHGPGNCLDLEIGDNTKAPWMWNTIEIRTTNFWPWSGFPITTRKKSC